MSNRDEGLHQSGWGKTAVSSELCGSLHGLMEGLGGMGDKAA